MFPCWSPCWLELLTAPWEFGLRPASPSSSRTAVLLLQMPRSCQEGRSYELEKSSLRRQRQERGWRC